MMATIERSVRLEPGASDDLDSVMTVMEAAFGTRYGEAWTRSQCAGILPMAGVRLTLARDPASGETVGFSLVRGVADESELLLLAVHPDRRREGIGTRLLEQFIDCALVSGAGRVHLEVRECNAAIHMYRSAGFVAVGRRRNYYLAADGRKFDALTFAREI
jgi:ribosomal-protein-alanine N-acetyltransferase